MSFIFFLYLSCYLTYKKKTNNTTHKNIIIDIIYNSDQRSKAIPSRTEFNTPTVSPSSSSPSTTLIHYRPVPIDGVILPLPASYELLDKQFSALETTASFIRGRDQPCVFHKIKKPVENISGRAFEWIHLERIKEVFPEAYGYTGCRIMLDEVGFRVDSVCLDMTDHASVGKSAPLLCDEKETKEKKSDNTKLFIPWGEHLAKRREEFRRRLVDRVKGYHMVSKLSFFSFFFGFRLNNARPPDRPPRSPNYPGFSQIHFIRGQRIALKSLAPQI